MYWITETVKFIYENFSIEELIPDDYSSFLNLLNQLFPQIFSINFCLHYQGKKKENLAIETEQDFNRIQDTGLKSVTVVITEKLEKAKSMPVQDINKHVNLFHSSSVPVSNTKSQDKVPNHVILSSVYKVKDPSKEKESFNKNFYQEEEIKGNGKTFLSAVYSSAIDENHEYYDMSRESSAPISQIKSYLDDFRSDKKKKAYTSIDKSGPVDEGKRKTQLTQNKTDIKDEQELTDEQVQSSPFIKFKGEVKEKQVLITKALKKQGHKIKDNVKSWFKPEK